MSPRALVIGEALIDIVERDGEVTGEHVGGSPLKSLNRDFHAIGVFTPPLPLRHTCHVVSAVPSQWIPAKNFD